MDQSIIRLCWVAAVATGVAACDVQAEPEGQAHWCESHGGHDAETNEHPLGQAVQQALQDAVDDGLPGVVIAFRDGDGVWEGAAGSADLGRDLPMQTCHRTRIASVTKTFVAATVMKLVDRGLIDLDEPLTDYLPQEHGRLPNADSITVRQLLSHTSGVYNFLDVSFVLELFNRPDRTWSTAQCYERAVKRKAEFSPGEDWSYSNTNYLLLGRVIEAVTELDQTSVVQRELLEPLGLDQTSYHVDDFDFGGVVRGYFDLFGDEALIDSTESYANQCVGPDGGMVSSAGDVLTFYDHLLARKDLVSETSLQSMMPFAATGESDFPEYGLGLEAWGEGERLGYGHGGQEFGYRTFAYHFPQQEVTFVVWFNASSLIPTDDNIAATINAHRDRLRDIVLRLTSD